YQTIHHPTSYSAQQTAAVAHVPGRELAKAVIVHIDGALAMVVQNASGMVPLGRVKAAAGARDVHLANEQEFRDWFPDCDLGAMPPFGNLYGMEVFVTEALTHDDEIAFNAGTHTELIRLRYADFARLAHPIVV
nr:YbaK/EbsC family protein [Steroidobacteraceae bacterium]